jgi:peptidoglycan/LPS O-acetylase OafA/YrhL
VKLTTHLHLLTRSRMRGAILPLPQYAFMAWYSVQVQGQFYLTLPLLYVLIAKMLLKIFHHSPLCKATFIILRKRASNKKFGFEGDKHMTVG